MSFLIDGLRHKLDLNKEIGYLSTLAKVCKHWDELNAKLQVDDGVEDFLDFVMRFDNIRNEIAPVLEEAGINAEELAEIVRKIRNTYDDHIPARAQLLLSPVSDFAELDEEVILHWKFLSLKESRKGRVSENDFAFDLGVATDARLEVEPMDQPYFVSDDVLLRLELAGDVGGHLALSADSPWGPARARAGVSASGALTHWFAIPRDSSDPLIQLVAKSLESLANPFQLRSIENCTTKLRLDRIRLASNFELRQEMTFKFNIAPTIRVPQIKKESMIEFDARATRQRLLKIEAYREDSNLVVHLALSKTRSAQRSAQWSFDIDVSGIATPVRNYVFQLAEEIKSFKKDYEEFLSPGTWLKNNAAELLDDFTSNFTDAGEAIDELTNDIVAEIDAGKRFLGNELEDIAASLAKKLKKRLPAQFHARADESVRRLLGELSEKFNSAIEERVKSTIEDGEEAATALFAKVNELEGIVQTKLNNLTTNANNATRRVRRILAKLEAVVAKLTSAVEKAATAKLQVRLWHEESIRTGQEADTILTFTSVDDKTSKVYDQLLRGQVSELEGLIKNPIPGVQVETAQFSEFLDRSTERGLAISLLGFEFKETDIFKNGSIISVDKDGHVIVHATASSARKIRSPWAAQRVAFASQFELWSAKQSSSASLAISATQEDRNLKLKELEDLLDDLVRVKLITNQVLEHAKSIVTEKIHPRRKLRATVDLLLPMLKRHIENLLASTQRINNDDAVIDRVLDVLVTTDVFGDSTITNAADAARRCLPRSLRLKLGDTNADVFKHFQPIPPGQTRKVWRQFAKLEFAETHLQNNRILIPGTPRPALRNAQEIHRLIKGYGVLLNTMSLMANMDPYETTPKDIDKAHRIVNLCLMRWVRVNRAFIFHPHSELHKNTLAFLVLLASDAGLPIGSETESAVSVAITLDESDTPYLIA